MSGRPQVVNSTRCRDAVLLTPTAIAGLNEVLLQCALRAERNKAGKPNPAADARAAEIARRWDERAAAARTA